MAFQDHFSRRSPAYSRYRPVYPDSLFKYLAQLAPRRDRAWDCATGSGQAAVGLSAWVDTVFATDASESQIRQARRQRGVHYLVASAEQAPFVDTSLDLVIVAQALHWFDADAFYAEVRRILCAGGVFGAIAYGLHRISPAVDRVVGRFYQETVGPYWHPARRHVEAGYSTLPFPFTRIATPQFEMTAHWTRAHLLGYLRTWSASEHYLEERGQDPVSLIEADLRDAWGSGTDREVSFPLVLHCGRKE